MHQSPLPTPNGYALLPSIPTAGICTLWSLEAFEQTRFVVDSHVERSHLRQLQPFRPIFIFEGRSRVFAGDVGRKQFVVYNSNFQAAFFFLAQPLLDLSPVLIYVANIPHLPWNKQTTSYGPLQNLDILNAVAHHDDI